jgi:hypothetical protein
MDVLDLDSLSQVELSERMIANWWQMRAMAIQMGVLIEDRLIALELMTDDQRAILPRRVRRKQINDRPNTVREVNQNN